MYRLSFAKNRTAEILATGLAISWHMWLSDPGYSRRVIFGGSVLQLYDTVRCTRSAFSATGTVLV